MPDYVVTSPEGKEYTVTAPDGATEQEVLSYAQSQFVSKPAATKAPIEKPGLAAEALGFLGGSAADIGKRLGSVYESYKATDFTPPNPFNPVPTQEDMRKQGVPEFAYQTVGQVAMGAGDILGNLAKAGYHQTFSPQSQEQIGSAASNAMQSFSQTAPGQYLGNAMQDYSKYATENPRAARNIETTAALGTLLPFGRATTEAGIALKESSNILKSKLSNIVTKADKMDWETLKAASSAGYKAAEDAGAAIRPEAMVSYAKEISPLAEFKTQIGRESAEIAGDLSAIKDIKKAQDIINNMAVGKSAEQGFDYVTGKATQQLRPIGLQSFNEVDQQLSEMLYAKGSKLTNDLGFLNEGGQKVKDMQEALRSKVFNAPEKDIIGDRDAFGILDESRKLWGKQLKMRDLDEMVGRSLINTTQPVTSLKKNFGALLNKIETGGKTPYKWTKEEIDIIRKIAESGKVSELLGLFGSRLPSSIMLGSGNVGGAMLSRAASEIPRSISKEVQLGRVQQLMNQIGGGTPETMGMGMARGTTNQALTIPANALNVLGTGLKYRAPQLTGLGLLTQEEQQ